MSLEGSLSASELIQLPGATEKESSALRRATLQPKLDFVVLPLTISTVAEIEKAIRSKISFTGYRGIIHAQIETNGKIAFAAYDNFHKDCVFVNKQVSSDYLDRLVETRVLHGYQHVQPNSARRMAFD